VGHRKQNWNYSIVVETKDWRESEEVGDAVAVAEVLAGGVASLAGTTVVAVVGIGTFGASNLQILLPVVTAASGSISERKSNQNET